MLFCCRGSPALSDCTQYRGVYCCCIHRLKDAAADIQLTPTLQLVRALKLYRRCLSVEFVHICQT
jgi:hypothetical protein